MPYDTPRRSSDQAELPPKSLFVIRKKMRESIRKALDSIKKAEQEFIAPHKDMYEEVAYWTKPLKAVLHGAKIPELSTTRMIEQIMVRIALPGQRFVVAPDDLAKLKQCIQKILEAVPDRFEMAIGTVRDSVAILGKYCLSFYDLARDPPLDTAIHYTTSSMQWRESVKKLIEQVRLMPYKFQGEVLVLNSQFFGSHAKHIASRSECEQLPFLLMFPQTCENLKEACEILLTWIDADENYARFIKNDIADLEQDKNKFSRLSRDLHEKCYHSQYKLKMLEADNLAHNNELADLRLQETNLLVADELLRKEINEKKIDLEIKEFRKAELRRDQDKLEPIVFQEKMDELIAEVKEIKEEMPLLQKKLEHLTTKLNRAQARIDKLLLSDNDIEQVRQNLAEAEKGRDDVERSLGATLDSYELAKKIYLHKTSPDMLEKMFYSIPIEIKTPRSGHHEQEKKEKNQLLRACNVIADAIGRDWCRMYRELPFEPARGELNIESDITNIVKSNPRDGHRDQARRGFYSWRRFHRRARLQDLKDALVKIKRQDILEEVEERLAPPVVEVVQETLPPPFLAEYLIPYFKEVERYDQYVAAHKV